MYIYLSKKIAIPNNIKVASVAWNKDDGFIAVGGDNGFLKLLKLDSGITEEKINYTLDGHTETIQVITWNDKYRKLTTSDRSGMIIVWMLYKGSWYEEMINNRKKSVVVDMTWNGDGTKICIAYEDGGIIVGSVGGSRIWGKDLKGVVLSKVQWSPDSKLLLFGLANGQIQIYDSSGLLVGNIDVRCLNSMKIRVDVKIVGLDWYNGQNGYLYAPSPILAICCENGYLQLMKSEYDSNVIVVDTKMAASGCFWNHNGSLLAVIGRQQLRDEFKTSNVVQFYSPFGEHLRTLKLPGQQVTCCSWEFGSLRIAFGIDSSVYFANIRPDYKWCYFKNTIVFSSGRLHKLGVCVSFWDTLNNQCHVQYVVALMDLAAFGNHCVLATRLDVDDPMGKFGLSLCNTAGTVVDAKFVDFEIKYVAMNAIYVAAASKTNYFLWQYRTPKTPTVNMKPSSYSIYHADVDPTGASVIVNNYEFPPDTQTSIDPICSIALSDMYLIIGKESGTIRQFVIPHVVIVKTFNLPVRAHKMSINCNSTRLSLIDMTGLLTVLDISESSFHHSDKENTRLERKDVWAMCWATDNPQLLAIMEKTRMYIFKGIYPEEPTTSTLHICSFQNLEIQGVMLDEIIETPEKPLKEHLHKLEVKSLRDTRQLLEKVGIKEASEFIKDNPHPRLWNLLGEAALRELDLNVAEIAFIRSEDYAGVKFVKKLQNTTKRDVKKGMVAAYFKNFEEAEKLFNESDRVDLTLHLRKTLGDWFRVIRLVKYGYYSTEGILKTAYNKTGDYFAHMNNWTAAKEYYELAKNKKELVKACFHIEDFETLRLLVDALDSSDPVLGDIAKGFAIEGDYFSSIKAYLKMQDLKAALTVSVNYHQWEQTIYIAKKHRVKEVAEIFMAYSDRLVNQGKLNRALELTVHARYWLSAAKYAIKLAKQESKIRKPINIKRIFVCAANFVELFKKDPHGDEIVDAVADVKLIENGWEGALAYHLFILAQHQLFVRQIHSALCTLYRLQNYRSYITPEKIYSMLALTAYFDRLFNLCSKMFVRLGTLSSVSEERKAEYDTLAFKLFSAHSPTDTKHKRNIVDCFNCQSAIHDWEFTCPCCNIDFPVCTASGRSIISEDTRKKTCSNCHHTVIEKYLGYRRNCPLCHSCLY
ncbi:hypothetical protein RN001_015912 [Aquatica leii]|uniref:WD repeat-containing protein 55 homolog n=1 Tax=Aquatica leii TaxID=1421715 RepID=A0AAN7QAX6_9COLE|nr:hypothetical protein RN001_015912 [Aquatica leii]